MDTSNENSKRKRNRNRSKRRPIYCPQHGCYLDSVSCKHPLYADSPEHLQQRGISRFGSKLLLLNNASVPLAGEWLEEFWCQECQQSNWYHVHRSEGNVYTVKLAPAHLWKRATGVINPERNPSVGEYSYRQSRMSGRRKWYDGGKRTS